jgi:membrane-associated phospholipid phosphatase/protein-S-isoprenylcysteine O-methyltransferase Ste14
MAITSSLPGKIFYALLFCVVLPVAFFWWGALLRIELPVSPHGLFVGWFLIGAGSLLMTEAMWRLWTLGHGLPMNAYPTLKYVDQGSYRLFHHPIYVGFCFCCAGISMLNQSASGLYVVTPVIVLLCVALVIGFENLSLKNRFGEISHSVFFGLRPDQSMQAGWLEKTGVFVSTFFLWLVLYKLTILITDGGGLLDTMTPVEKKWPVLPLAEIPYAATYLFAALVPFILKTKRQLRTFQLNAWYIIASGVFLQFIFPFYAQPRDFEPQGLLGRMIAIERASDGMNAAFPSFHVMWALVAAISWTEVLPKGKYFWWSLAALMIISCIGVGVHSLADVIAGVLVFAVVMKRVVIWRWLNDRSERLANSWREWHLGKFRVINHSLYAGLAAMVGFLIASQFSMNTNALLFTILCSFAGGALWGQFIEGSHRLLRPFGYFGALLGGVAGLVISKWLFQEPVLQSMAAIAMAAPWVQAIGRLRCLVQGCCHGTLTHSDEGIRYVNKHSRVCLISDLKGRKVYNTQLFSILFNIVIGLIIFRLWYAHASPALLAGFYFILGGAARFVEEAYRGEKQTKVIMGLPVYQWLSIASIVAGMIVTVLPVSETLVLRPILGFSLILKALVTGFLWAFGMGMDFPHSNIRFSRLSG